MNADVIAQKRTDDVHVDLNHPYPSICKSEDAFQCAGSPQQNIYILLMLDLIASHKIDTGGLRLSHVTSAHSPPMTWLRTFLTSQPSCVDLTIVYEQRHN
jgi:hypothetical protein